MRLNNVSFPYPVLGVKDDVLPLLGSDCVKIDLETTPDTYKFRIALSQNNEVISQLIKDGYAEYSCEVDCQKAFLRQSFSSNISVFDVLLPRRLVNGRVNFNGFITVKKAIKQYTNSGFNEDYDGYSFDLEPGDILAAFPQAHFDADIKFDKLQAAGSFMVIREDVTLSQTRFDIAGDKIEIVFPTYLYNMFKGGVGDAYMDIIHSSVVFNALCYALYNIEENSETLWARCVNTRIETEPNLACFKDLDKLQVPELAQALLGDPYRRMMEKLLNLHNSQTIEEED